jgi:hypothetical protein
MKVKEELGCEMKRFIS